jgi:hypothetical protein
VAKADPFAELNRLEEKNAAEVGAQAGLETQDAIGKTLRAVAAEALKEHQDSEAQRLAVLDAVRHAILDDAMSAAALLTGIINRARLAGYTDRLEGLARIYSDDTGSEATAIVEVTPREKAALQQWPILGHGGIEWANRSAANLQWEVEGLLSMIASGSVAVDELTPRIDAINDEHVRRAKSIVDDAYLAGTAAAQKTWTEAIRRTGGA